MLSIVGIPGVLSGVIDAVAPKATDVPAEFVAVIVKKYVVPSTKLAMSQVVVGAVAEQVNPPVFEDTRYESICPEGAVQDMVAVVPESETVAPVGAERLTLGVSDSEFDAAPESVFTARMTTE